MNENNKWFFLKSMPTYIIDDISTRRWMQKKNKKISTN
jgi:hypothetical protein